MPPRERLSAEAAFGQLTGDSARAGPRGGYAQTTISPGPELEKGWIEPGRGVVWPAVVEDIALPPPGAKPVSLAGISDVIDYLFANFRDEMLPPEHLVDREGYHAVKPHMGPLSRGRRQLLHLLARMYLVNMIQLTDRKEEEVYFFCVVKKVDPETKRVMLRLVWDIRKGNFRWRKPPRGELGSPACFGLLDVSGPISMGVKLSGFAGDIPDFYSTCRISDALLPFFAVSGVTSVQLANYLQEEFGVTILEDITGLPFVSLAVLGMGWAWACYLAQTALEAVMNSGAAPSISSDNRVSDVLYLPLLRKLGQCLHRGSIADYAGVTVGSRAAQDIADSEAKDVGLQLRRAFEFFGWAIHKEESGPLQVCLGYKLDWAKAIARSADKHFWAVRDATAYALRRPRVAGKDIERSVGTWVWVAMITRCALSIFHAIYRWIGKYRDRPGLFILGHMARGELAAMRNLAILFFQNMALKWHLGVCLTASSPDGGALLWRPADRDRPVAESVYAEKRGWFTRLEAAAAEVVDHLDQEISAPAAPSLSQTPRAVSDGPEVAAQVGRDSASPLVAKGVDHWPFSFLPLRFFVILYLGIDDSLTEDLPGKMARGAALKGVLIRSVVLRSRALQASFWEAGEVWGDLLQLADSGRLAGVVAALPSATWDAVAIAQESLPPIRWWVGSAPMMSSGPGPETAAFARREDLALQRLSTLADRLVGRGGFAILRGPHAIPDCSPEAGSAAPSLFDFEDLFRLLSSVLFHFRTVNLGGHKPGLLRMSGVPIAFAPGPPNASLWGFSSLEAVVGNKQLGHVEFMSAVLHALAQTLPALLLEDLRLGPRFDAPSHGAGARPKELVSKPIPEVCEEWTKPAGWVECFRTRWRVREHNNIGELRMVVSAVRHFARRSEGNSARVMVVTDSLVSLGCVAKGRSSSFPPSRLLRCLAAFCLAGQIKVYTRFVRSENNSADGPSRGFAIGQAPKYASRAERPGPILHHTTKKARRKRGLLSRLRKSGLPGGQNGLATLLETGPPSSRSSREDSRLGRTKSKRKAEVSWEEAQTGPKCTW